MIRLGLRLALSGGREALVRLVVTAIAVGLGVALLLASLASMNAVNAQSARGAWLNQQPVLNGPPGSPSPAIPGSEAKALWWLPVHDDFQGRPITRIDVAASGPRPPLPPGLSRLPGPGQYVVSPALATLIRQRPAAELGDRFFGHEVGTIGAAGVPNPASLIAVVGYRAGVLSKAPGAFELTSISVDSPANAEQYLVVLAIAALALLFPVLVFLDTATRLSAARREQRFAALRRVGATPRQVAQIAAVEAAVSAVAGTLSGFVLFVVLRPALQHVPITGAPFAPGDLPLNVGEAVLVASGVPLGATFAARLALRRVMTSPLEVRARTSRRPPRGMRLLPLAAGLVWMSALAIAGHASGKAAVYLDFLGALLIMAGIVIAGPWLIALGADVAVKRTKRTDVLLAGRRLSDDPRAAFRAISGLVVALFVMSAITGVVSTIVADHGAPAGGAMAVATLTDVLGTPLREGASAPALPAQLLANLRAIKGVGGVAVVRSDPFDTALGLVSCAQLARTPALGRCAPGAVVAAIDRSATWSHGFTNTTDLAGRTWPSASIDVRRLASLAPEEIVVGTDGSTAAIESARTALELGFAYQSQAPLTMGETLSATAQTRTELGNVANVIIGASLVIAGCSLAVGATAAVSDRKRPFSLLRLTGAPVSMLRRVVGLEAAAPLVVAAVLGAGLGLLGAELFLRSELSVSLRWPGLLYLLVVIGGIALSLVVISSTLPLIERITGPDVARSE